jgi:molecular chaperone GrpE
MENKEQLKIIKESGEKDILNENKILKEKLEKSEKLAEERLNQLKYLQADFENLKKRYEKEKQNIIKSANESLIKELIVLLDDLDAAIKISEQENKTGYIMLKNKFFDILVCQGLGEIEAIGKKFNPEFHEALCRELSKHNEDDIIDEIQKGYMFCSKVIRASKVKVSKGLKDDDKTKIKDTKTNTGEEENI